MNLKFILLIERRQFIKATLYMVPVLGHTGKGKTITKIKMSWVTMDLGVVMG